MWKVLLGMAVLVIALAGVQWIQLDRLGSRIEGTIRETITGPVNGPTQIKIVGDSMRLGVTWETNVTITGHGTVKTGCEFILVQNDGESEGGFETRFQADLKKRLDKFDPIDGTLKAITFQTLAH